jgi:Ca2+-transporting ATPase
MYSTQTIDETLAGLATTRDGLSDHEVHQRIEKYGYNEIPEKKRSLLLLFLKQFNSVLVYILFAALALSIVLPFYEHGGELGLSDFIDAIAIGAILILNACLGFFQEKKAENAIAVLQAMSAPSVRVRRGGVVKIIPSRELVPGDILLLEEGDRISADGRVFKVQNAAIDEASLTGESAPARKQKEVLKGEPVVADQENMVFKGTVVTDGRLEVCVTGTALETGLGKIAKLVTKVEHPPTPLEISMNILGKWLGIVVLVFCSIIFIVGAIRQLPIGEMLLAAASLAVSAVPEGLPAIVTVCLAIGVQRMIKRRVLTRELQAIETLGSITVICSDKTGTITENQMEVQEVSVPDGPWHVFRVQETECPTDITGSARLALRIGASCNNAHSLEVGDPTEIGLLEAAQKCGIDRLEIEEEDVPFTSLNLHMMTTHCTDDGHIKYIKGAPEKVFSLCTHVLRDGKEEKMTDALHQEFSEKNEEMATRALRVLAMAYRIGDKTVCVGLVGMMDPARDGVKEAIGVAKRAGIRTVMITGDHALTAKAIAEHVGIISEAISGEELEKMSDEQLQEAVQKTSVFARVSPTQKVRILEALQERGEIVAMGGDGVNDAPALKKAHVGFAMGKQGTDVARETAEIVLTDDHFASVVEAVEEGRTIYDNIRKFVKFLLRANFDELAVVLGAILIGIPLPYFPIHILLINLMTDSLPAMALAMEKPEPNVMQRPPRDPKEHILHGEFLFIFLAAAIATFAAFQIFFYAMSMEGGNVDIARTMVVTASIFFELTLVFTCRSQRSLLSIGPFSNHYLVGAVSIAFVLFLICMYTPLNIFLHLVPLTLNQWVLPIVWSFGALAFFEGLKLFHRK